MTLSRGMAICTVFPFSHFKKKNNLSPNVKALMKQWDRCTDSKKKAFEKAIRNLHVLINKYKTVKINKNLL